MLSNAAEFPKIGFNPGTQSGKENTMPKMKTHKGAKSRVKVTATGKVVAKRPGKRHLNWHKSGSSIRSKGRSFTFSEGEAERVKVLLPYE